MKKIALLGLVLSFSFQIFAQTPKKAIPIEEINQLKSIIKPGADLSFNFGVSSSLLKGDYPRNNEELEIKKKEALKKLEANPNDPDLIHIYGTYLEKEEASEYYKRALETLEKNVGTSEPTAEDFCLAGKIMLAAQNYRGSYEYYQMALKKDPENIAAISKMSMFSYFQQDFKQTQINAKKALDLDLSDIDAHIFYIQSFVVQRIAMLNAQEENGGLSSKSIDMEYKADFSYIEKAAAKLTDKPYYQVLEKSLKLLDVFYRTMVGVTQSTEAQEKMDKGDFSSLFSPSVEDAEALKNFAKYFQTVGDKADRLFIDHALATIYLLQNEIEYAEKKMQSVLEQNQLGIDYYYNLAFLLSVQKNWKGAIEIIDKKMSIDKSPKDYQILTLLYERQDKIKKAYEISKNLEEFAPENAEYYEIISVMAFKNGDYETAKSYFGKIAADNPNLLLMQAVLALDSKDWTAARSALKAAAKEQKAAQKLLENYFE